jgi:hypothetical protein
MKFGALVVKKSKNDPVFKAQVLKELRRQLSRKNTAECKEKLLRALTALEKIK